MFLSAALIVMHLPLSIAQGVARQPYANTNPGRPNTESTNIQSVSVRPQFRHVRFPGLTELSLREDSDGRSKAGKLVADSTNPPKDSEPQQTAPLGRINLGTAPSTDVSIRPYPRQPLEARRTNHLWLALSVAQHSAATFDAWSTRRAVGQGYAETDPLMRPFAHSPAIYAAIQIVPLGLDYLGMHMMHSSHSWMRKTWWLPQAAATVGYLFSGAHNLTMGR